MLAAWQADVSLKMHVFSIKLPAISSGRKIHTPSYLKTVVGVNHWVTHANKSVFGPAIARTPSIGY